MENLKTLTNELKEAGYAGNEALADEIATQLEAAIHQYEQEKGATGYAFAVAYVQDACKGCPWFGYDVHHGMAICDTLGFDVDTTIQLVAPQKPSVPVDQDIDTMTDEHACSYKNATQEERQASLDWFYNEFLAGGPAAQQQPATVAVVTPQQEKEEVLPADLTEAEFKTLAEDFAYWDECAEEQEPEWEYSSNL